MYEKKPMAIENRSMDIIDSYLRDVNFSAEELPLVRRMIHTTGDPEYRKIIRIRSDFFSAAKEAIASGAKIYTDTNMVRSGINKKALAKSGCTLITPIAEAEVAEEAEARGTTRSIVALEKAIERGATAFVFGNAPTALFRLLECIDAKRIAPNFVVATVVGFVGAAESKAAIAAYDVPHLRTEGTKGGSNVAASVINGLLYEMGYR